MKSIISNLKINVMKNDINENKALSQTSVSSSIYKFSDNNLEKTRKVPIYKGCANNGQCFCTGKCNEIIGWRDKLPNEF